MRALTGDPVWGGCRGKTRRQLLSLLLLCLYFLSLSLLALLDLSLVFLLLLW